jgi:hypothetical protein
MSKDFFQSAKECKIYDGAVMHYHVEILFN